MPKLSILRALLLLGGVLALSAAAKAQLSIGVSVRIGPPPLPVYEQPLCPGDGYIWTPGYWAWGADGYFWVPGTWVIAPRVGYLWTPGYWGWGEGVYVWHPGYWGPHIGFYGGINYGFGYTGVGYVGGEWRGRTFVYNRAVTNVNVAVVHNTYTRTVINNVAVNRVSYNGGAGGIATRPTAAEEHATREQHIAPVGLQTQHEHAAASNRALLASENHGRPPIAATVRPGQFSGREVVAAHEANERAAERPARQENVRERPTIVQPEQPHNQVRPTVARPEQQPRNQVPPTVTRPEQQPRNQVPPTVARPEQQPRNQVPPTVARPQQPPAPQEHPTAARPQQPSGENRGNPGSGNQSRERNDGRNGEKNR